MTTTVVWHPACRHHEAVDAALDGWRPELLLVSAGFDSLAGDPDRLAAGARAHVRALA